MPFKTRYGSHYHMTQGCHGATIPCGTEGLTPCSDCCEDTSASFRGQSDGGTGSHATGGLQDGGDGHGGAPSGGEPDEAGASASRRLGEIFAVTGQLSAAVRDGQAMPSPDGIPASALVAMAGDDAQIEGADYDGKGQGWPVRQRGQRFHMPGGSGYSYLTRRQAGILYAAAKRGDVTMDAAHSKEMYGIVGIPWSDMDVHDRRVYMLLSEAIDHMLAGRQSLAQACLDGKTVESKRISVGTRKVVVTEDNWIDFAFDLDHDYEVGDVAEEEVFRDVWVISDIEWDEPLERRR